MLVLLHNDSGTISESFCNVLSINVENRSNFCNSDIRSLSAAVRPPTALVEEVVDDVGEDADADAPTFFFILLLLFAIFVIFAMQS